MKIDKATRDAYASVIVDLDTPRMRDLYRTRAIPRGDAVRDIDVRYRWDCMWAAQSIMRAEGALPTWPGGIHDSHIDTMLRSIVKPL